MNYQSAAENTVGDRGAGPDDDRNASNEVDQEEDKRIDVNKDNHVPSSTVSDDTGSVSESGDAS